jgi:hypothetical protein
VLALLGKRKRGVRRDFGVAHVQAEAGSRVRAQGGGAVALGVGLTA